MNVVGGGSPMGGQQLSPQQQQQQQCQQQVAGPPQMNRYLSVNGTAMDETMPSRRTPVVNILNAKGYAQIQFDTVTEQELQRQLDEFNKTITIVLWYKAQTEPLRIQHTIRSFPFFQLSGLTAIVNGLGLTDDVYLDTYIPESGYWMQHTIHTVRIVESQQRLLYKIRKNLLDSINEEDCISLMGEIDLQQQLISSKKQPSVSQPRSSLDLGLPTPITPAVSSSLKDVSDKNSRKRLASEVHPQEYEQTPTKVHIPNNFYLTPHNETAGPDVTTTSTPVLPPATVVDDHTTSSTNDVDNVNHASAGSEYLYQNTVYYPPASPLSSPNPPEAQLSGADTTGGGAVPYHTHAHLAHSHLPLKRWPNDYSVAEISAGFHDMDRLVAQTPNMTQRVAFERVFGSRYVKSTVCRHRGVWKRAPSTMRDQFISFGNDERALWGEFVRTVEGRQSAKAAAARSVAVVSSVSHETIPFVADTGAEGELVDVRAGSDPLQGQGVSGGHENGVPGAVEEPIMDSLQHPTTTGEDDVKDPDNTCEFSTPSDAGRSILNEFVFAKWQVVCRL
ncbi:hypothetical protein APHAL10511_008587 [Amanita phalloides]|nr:hypothetical protein APHAL10511_008587 [Amanita phalloides]